MGFTRELTMANSKNSNKSLNVNILVFLIQFIR